MSTKSKILVVDDKQVNILILTRFLKKYDYIIETAESGLQALDVAQEFHPDVVLMDICMPGMDGIECINKMKKSISDNFFVIFITALKDSETKRKAFSVGATSFMNKPVDLKSLKRTIDKCLRTRGFGESTISSFDVLKNDQNSPKVLEEYSDTESRNLHLNKMNNLGQLSSSVAHDINNYLGGILGNISLIELSTEDEEILNCCREIKKAVNNTSDLTGSLTAYSKKETSNKMLVNLADSLNDAVNLLERDVRYTAVVDTFYEDWQVLIKGVYSELTNIFLNILKNAYQAVDDDGHISVSLKKTTFVEAQKVYQDLLPQGEYAIVNITDNGKGIDPEILKHIFEPFFTTKEEGTGLGLSSVHKYLNKNNGSLEVSSELEIGTSVNLYFEISGSGEGSKTEMLNESSTNADLDGLRFVVMDDDVIFCSSLTGYLKKHNASVVSFTDKSFVDFLDVNPSLSGYDVLIVDYQSPFFNSVELIEELSEKNKTINSYIISGSKIDVSDIKRCGFFRKPLNFRKMVDKLLEDKKGK